MNRNFYVISQLLRGSWLIDPDFAQSHLPVIRAYLEGKGYQATESQASAGEKIGQKTCFAVASSRRGTADMEETPGDLQYFAMEEAPAGSTAVIRVNGTLMKEDFCGAPGTATLKAYLQKAARHPNIGGALLLVDSPGGTVDGTQDLAQAVKNFPKPIFSFVDGLSASAAYWIASSADRIYANNDTAMIGSIGTMITLRDYRALDESLGIKEHIITADKSRDKNRAYLEALEGNYKPIKEQTLNPLNEIFLNSVRTNRPQVSEKALSGKVFLTEEALSVGLIDAMGEFSQVIKELEKQSKKSNNQNKNNMSLKDWFNGGASASAVVKVEAAELDQLKADMQAAQQEIENLTGERENLSAQLAEISGQKDKLSAELAEAQSQITALTAERDQFKELAAQYGAQPGALHSEPVKPAGDQLEEDPNKAILENLPSNQELKDNPYFN